MGLENDAWDEHQLYRKEVVEWAAKRDAYANYQLNHGDWGVARGMAYIFDTRLKANWSIASSGVNAFFKSLFAPPDANEAAFLQAAEAYPLEELGACVGMELERVTARPIASMAAHFYERELVVAARETKVLAGTEKATGAARSLEEVLPLLAREGADTPKPLIVYHGTTSNRASKIVKQGFRPRGNHRDVFFAEDLETAKYFALDKAGDTGARQITVIRMEIPRALAEELGLTQRHLMGARTGLIVPDVPGSRMERILESFRIPQFNELLKSREIEVTRLHWDVPR